MDDTTIRSLYLRIYTDNPGVQNLLMCVWLNTIQTYYIVLCVVDDIKSRSAKYLLPSVSPNTIQTNYIFYAFDDGTASNH